MEEFDSEVSPEMKKNITREEIVEAYRKFTERGITNPDDLNMEDSEVQKVNELFEQWQRQEDKHIEGNEELKYRNNLAKTMLNVDAGFIDPEYLEEVLEWLNNDLDDLEKDHGDSLERTETHRQIIEAIKKVESLLSDKQN